MVGELEVSTGHIQLNVLGALTSRLERLLGVAAPPAAATGAAAAPAPMGALTDQFEKLVLRMEATAA